MKKKKCNFIVTRLDGRCVWLDIFFYISVTSGQKKGNRSIVGPNLIASRITVVRKKIYLLHSYARGHTGHAVINSAVY